MSHGKIYFYNVYKDRYEFLCSVKNEVVYGGGEIYAHAVAGDTDYVIRTAIFEFINLASPSDTITYPSLDKTRDVGYYLGLETSTNVDIIRTPIIVPVGYSGSGGNYTGFNNISTFYAVTTGATGYWGKTFSASANSTIYGIALAASPDINDLSSDIIFSASYGDMSSLRLAKQANAQISITYPITHEVE